MTGEEIYSTIRQSDQERLCNHPELKEMIIKYFKENRFDQYYDPEDDCIENFRLERYLKVWKDHDNRINILYCEFDNKLAEDRKKKGFIKENLELCDFQLENIM